ncbi:MAG: hypothetical protein M1834_003188 [Cirrosporium novae-zelandiae]|nr:MAG: hypothetical protein M1834_003188 [Cirrosporium novae-zelandiae]
MQSTVDTVKTRLCLISDTHTAILVPAKDISHAYREPLPTSDVLLHAGDITIVGKAVEYRKVFNMLKDAPAELKIIIAGNHDITLDQDYYINGGGNQKHHGKDEDVVKIKELWCGAEAQKHGIVYMEEGVRSFRLKNGAKFTVYASPYQPAFMDWAFMYNKDQDRFNPSAPMASFKAPNPVPAHPEIDIMLTHGPPYGYLDITKFGGMHVGCPHLLRATRRCRPRLHCFGHIHEGWGAKRVDWMKNQAESLKQDKKQVLENRSAYIDASNSGKQPLKFGEETILVNASIMDASYRRSNAPFIVDLDLPVIQTGGTMLDV